MLNKIFTLMLNPAIDVTACCDAFEMGKENRVITENIDAGGKAVNVSRVLRRFDIDAPSVILLGADNADQYLNKLKEENISTAVIKVPGRIRENISILTPDGKITRLIRKGFTVSKSSLEIVKTEIVKRCGKDTCCVISGSLPSGMVEEELEDICLEIKKTGALIALDTRVIKKERLLNIKPFIIKPNDEEFAELTGADAENIGDMKAKALELIKSGISNVILSLGTRGMMYLSEGGA
ncbi:MAG: PfkB family carbohydrate kinase, partial [Bacillota bacterium]|nr:PfkB family carbohydrate kinase [Bacillota bacterium]